MKEEKIKTDPAPADRVVMPVVGESWSCRGFEFRVDGVNNGQVYFVRWRGDQKVGIPMRCGIALWQSEMADATKIRAA